MLYLYSLNTTLNIIESVDTILLFTIIELPILSARHCMTSWCFPVTNMTPCLLHFGLLTPQLTHSLTKHADWYAYSFLYSAMSHSHYAYSYVLIPCLLFDYKAPIVLLHIPYKSPLLLQILLTPPYVYKLLLVVCQCKQSVPCFKVVLKTSLTLYCALSVHFCHPLSSLWVL